MGILDTVGLATNTVAAGSSALSIVGLTKALVTPDNPPPGIAGFLFDIPETEQVSHTAQITDHWTEENYAIQDHVAFEPIKITLTGRVGELVYKKSAAASYVSQVIGRLGPLGVLQPSVSQKAAQYISEGERLVNAAESALNEASTLFDVVSGSKPKLNKQQQAFATFQTYFFGRARLTVQTPWKTYQNMIIESWTADQAADTTTESSFTLTFKQLRIVSSTINVGILKGRIKPQKAEPVNLGKQQDKSAAITAAEWLNGKK
jgi:hypothetical protein